MKLYLKPILLMILCMIILPSSAQAVELRSESGDIKAKTDSRFGTAPQVALKKGNFPLQPAVAEPLDPGVVTGSVAPPPQPSVIQADNHQCPQGYYCKVVHSFFESCHLGEGTSDCNFVAQYCQSGLGKADDDYEKYCKE